MKFITKHFRTPITKLALANYTVFWLSFATPITYHYLLVIPRVNKVQTVCIKEIKMESKQELKKHCTSLGNRELIDLTLMNSFSFFFSYLLMSSIIFNVYIHVNVNK
jgi:hypothetical protein